MPRCRNRRDADGRRRRPRRRPISTSPGCSCRSAAADEAELAHRIQRQLRHDPRKPAEEGPGRARARATDRPGFLWRANTPAVACRGRSLTRQPPGADPGSGHRRVGLRRERALQPHLPDLHRDPGDEEGGRDQREPAEDAEDLAVEPAPARIIISEENAASGKVKAPQNGENPAVVIQRPPASSAAKQHDGRGSPNTSPSPCEPEQQRHGAEQRGRARGGSPAAGAAAAAGSRGRIAAPRAPRSPPPPPASTQKIALA